MNDNNLQHIWDAIAAPLNANQIKSKKSWYTDKETKLKKEGKPIFYIDKTTVEERLNSVCPGDWHFQVTPVVVPPNGSDGQWVVKGTLTICGVTREDFGMNDNEEGYDPPKAAVSDALKRCAALFGLGRQLVPGHSAGAPEIKVGGGKAPAAPKVESQKPAQAATAPAGVDQTTGEITGQPDNGTHPESIEDQWATLNPFLMSELTGQELYFIQQNAWRRIGMDHQKHFENRWKKRYPGVKTLKEMPGTVGDFLMGMADEVAAGETVAGDDLFPSKAA